ncbi:MAG TPA: hypothetical protein VMU27_02315 [Candidatus Paceibacterota bacterium]|nr:hypothetical protein [Candidatus Paceibacterota bacterium]
MANRVILIAGGSGAGKSTLAISLCTKYPQSVALVHQDDYYKSTEEAPKLSDGSPNWDTPEALRFDALYNDVHLLASGVSIIVMTKGELYNPAYRPYLRNKVECVIKPRPVILLEGHLALYDHSIRNLATAGIYLDMPIERSVQRRGPNKFTASEGYIEETLIPLHRRWVERTKRYATMILEVSRMQQAFVVSKVEAYLKQQGITMK